MPRITVSRLAGYAAGVLILSAGIVTTIRADLGVSPVNSVPFVMSVLSPMSLGVASFVVYVVQVALQVLVLGRRTTIKVPLQLAGAFAFAGTIGAFNEWLPSRHGGGLAASIALLALGIVLTAVGTALVVRANLIVSPPDGVVQSISVRTGRDFGHIKIANDCVMVAIAAAIGLIAGGTVIGIGVGTVASALLVGYVVRRVSRGMSAASARRAA